MQLLDAYKRTATSDMHSETVYTLCEDLLLMEEVTRKEPLQVLEEVQRLRSRLSRIGDIIAEPDAKEKK